MKNRFTKTLFLIALIISCILLSGANCYSDGGDSSPNSSSTYDEKNSPVEGSSSVEEDPDPIFAHPAADTVIETKLGKREALTVEIAYGGSAAYRWEVNKGGSWEKIYEYGTGRHFTTDAMTEENIKWKYHCIVSVVNRSGKWITLTSPTFSFKLAEESSSSSSQPAPSSSSSSAGSSSSNQDNRHRHTWEKQTTTTPISETVIINGFQCNGCSFFTTNKAEMEIHGSKFGSTPGHGGHSQSSSEPHTATMGYSCSCSLGFENQAALEGHIASATGGHGLYGYICYCGLNLTLDEFSAHYDGTCEVENPLQPICTCSSVFIGERELYDHIDAESQGHSAAGYYWDCSCELSFDSESEKDAHIASTGETVYSCNGCSFSTKDKAEMDAHDRANGPTVGHGGYREATFETTQVTGTKTETIQVCTGCGATRP